MLIPASSTRTYRSRREDAVEGEYIGLGGDDLLDRSVAVSTDRADSDDLAGVAADLVGGVAVQAHELQIRVRGDAPIISEPRLPVATWKTRILSAEVATVLSRWSWFTMVEWLRCRCFDKRPAGRTVRVGAHGATIGVELRRPGAQRREALELLLRKRRRVGVALMRPDPMSASNCSMINPAIVSP